MALMSAQIRDIGLTPGSGVLVRQPMGSVEQVSEYSYCSMQPLRNAKGVLEYLHWDRQPMCGTGR